MKSRSTRTCIFNSVFVQEGLLSLAGFCSFANCSKKLMLDSMYLQLGEMSTLLLIVSDILSFLYLLKDLSHAYSCILIVR